MNNLSIDQLSQIYQGKITNWKEVGGDDLKIVVISRDSSSGTFESWDHFVMKKQKLPPGRKCLPQRSDCAGRGEKSLRHQLSGDRLYQQRRETVAGQWRGRIGANCPFQEYPLSRRLYMYTNGEPRVVWPGT